jgi:Glyoxalase/Bleomycin resistance protein/Dioxygenase superfamily
MVELVKDHTIGPSPVRDIVGDGGEGLHHLAFFAPDLPALSAQLAARGWPEALYAETASGQVFMFHDASATLGHMIELYEPTPALLGFYAAVRDTALDWDGSEPVRSVRSLRR